MYPFLKLIRWQNLLLIVLVQLLIKYALFEPFLAATALSNLNMALLVVASVCIAAAGNIINDVYDVTADKINKPKRVIINTHISEKNAMNFFIALNIIGMGIGFYISHKIGKSSFVSLFALLSVLLYIYTPNLKGIPVIGNLVVSLIVSASILIVGVFDLLPEITLENRVSQLSFFKILFGYGIFAFVINFLREFVKDIEDTNGDYKAGYNTLPIIIGRDRATRIAFIFAIALFAVMVYYLVNYLNNNMTAVVYYLITVTAPLLYVIIKLFNAKNTGDYKHINLILKVIMLMGILSLLLYPLTLK